MRYPERSWINGAYKLYCKWLKGYGQPRWWFLRSWGVHLPEMLLWYRTAGNGALGVEPANTFLRKVQRRRLNLLPPPARRAWEEAKMLAKELCGKQGTNPVDWFTGGCGSLERGWARLDAVYSIGPKIASWIMRDLSFMRDYSTGRGGLSVSETERRNPRWYRDLPPHDQALFLPIDQRALRGARRCRASRAALRHTLADIQIDGDLHRRVGREIAEWARKRRLDPRELNAYWYMHGSGWINEDGTEIDE